MKFFLERNNRKITCFLCLISVVGLALFFRQQQQRQQQQNSNGFDDDIPRELESLLLSGEMIKYIDFSHLEQSFHRKLLKSKKTGRNLNAQNDTTTTLDLRPCNELIFTHTSEEVRGLVKQYLSSLLTEDFPLRELMDDYVDRKYKSGMKSYKICSSCAEYRDEYGGVGADSLNPFDSYCGEGKFGADAIVSGLLIIPVSDDGEFVEEESNMALWNRWVEYAAEEVPSEQFLNSSTWGTSVDEMEARGYTPTGIITGGVGVVTLLPDFLGYGESYTYDATPFNKHGYQVGSATLVLKARDFVKEVSGGKTTLSNYVISSGYSEGGMAAVANGDAIHELGFRVKTQTGGGLFDHTGVNGVFKFLRKLFTTSEHRSFYSGFLGWGASLSSTNLDLPNTNQGQDFLREVWRDEVVSWYRGDEKNYNFRALQDKIYSLIPNRNFSDFFNPDIVEMILNATDEDAEISEVCELSEEGKTDKFCEAIAVNDMKENLANANHPTTLCWSDNDQIFPAEANLPSLSKRFFNRHIRTLIIPSFATFTDSIAVGEQFNTGHQIVGGFCIALWGLVFHKQIY